MTYIVFFFSGVTQYTRLCGKVNGTNGTNVDCETVCNDDTSESTSNDNPSCANFITDENENTSCIFSSSGSNYCETPTFLENPKVFGKTPMTTISTKTTMTTTTTSTPILG
jgi:hypothetical protein